MLELYFVKTLPSIVFLLDQVLIIWPGLQAHLRRFVPWNRSDRDAPGAPLWRTTGTDIPFLIWLEQNFWEKWHELILDGVEI